MAPIQPARSLAIGAVLSLLLLAYGMARYGDALLTSFYLDDFWLLRDAYRIEREPALGLLAIFVPSQAGFALYRPLTQAGYFYALRLLFGLDASAYHAVQLMAFILNSALALAIGRALTASWVRAAAVAVLYAAAPGHVVAVYWMAAFTMSGTALAVFAALLWWLCTRGRWRSAGSCALQVIALLCSEHAVVLPALLFLTARFGPRRESGREAARAIAPAAVVSLAYLAAKACYFATVGAPTGAYALHVDPLGWLDRLGRYAAATLNLVTLADLGRGAAIGLGATIGLTAVAAVVLASRGHSRWRVAALGLTLFVVSLIPVLPLRAHYYDYFVGVAALGMAIGLVGLCDLVPSWGATLSAGLAFAVVATDLTTCDRAVLRNEMLHEVIAGSDASSDLVMSLYSTAQRVGSDVEIVVPRSALTDYVIDLGSAHEVFFEPPLLVSVTSAPTAALLGAQPHIVPLLRADPRAAPVWWNADWDWLRRAGYWAHNGYASWCSGSE